MVCQTTLKQTLQQTCDSGSTEAIEELCADKVSQQSEICSYVWVGDDYFWEFYNTQSYIPWISVSHCGSGGYLGRSKVPEAVETEADHKGTELIVFLILLKM